MNVSRYRMPDGPFRYAKAFGVKNHQQPRKDREKARGSATPEMPGLSCRKHESRFGGGPDEI